MAHLITGFSFPHVNLGPIQENHRCPRIFFTLNSASILTFSYLVFSLTWSSSAVSFFSALCLSASSSAVKAKEACFRWPLPLGSPSALLIVISGSSFIRTWLWLPLRFLGVVISFDSLFSPEEEDVDLRGEGGVDGMGCSE